MRFFSTLLVGASALASVVSAQAVLFTWQVPASVQVGQTYNVTYNAAQLNSPVTIILRKGVNTDLKTVETLTSTATGGTYQWTPSKSIVNGADYALQILQGGQDNYSRQFAVSGSTAVASSSASGSSSATASSSASASGSSSSSAATTLSSSVSGNSTVTASSSGASKTGASTTATGSSAATGSKTSASATSAPTGAAANVKSPLALVFGAVAAMVYLH